MNNSVASMNYSTFEYLKLTFVFQFKNMFFDNNKISFNNETVDLENFELETILNHNSYITTQLSEQEVWDIIKIHVDVHNKLIEENNNSDLISLNRFINLARKKDDYSLEEKKEIDNFFELYKRMSLYEDYLTPEIKEVLVQIKKVLDNLEVEVL